MLPGGCCPVDAARWMLPGGCCPVDAAAEGRAAHQPEHPPCARRERWLTTLLHCAALPEPCVPLTSRSRGPPRAPWTCVTGATAVSVVSAWPLWHGWP